jgi:hypothetical protein
VAAKSTRTAAGTGLAMNAGVGKKMNHSETKLAVRTVVVGYRSAKDTARLVGGSRGDEIKARAKTKAHEILDAIDQDGTDAEDEKQAARREVRGLTDE